MDQEAPTTGPTSPDRHRAETAALGGAKGRQGVAGLAAPVARADEANVKMLHNCRLLTLARWSVSLETDRPASDHLATSAQARSHGDVLRRAPPLLSNRLDREMGVAVDERGERSRRLALHFDPLEALQDLLPKDS